MSTGYQVATLSTQHMHDHSVAEQLLNTYISIALGFSTPLCVTVPAACAIAVDTY